MYSMTDATFLVTLWESHLNKTIRKIVGGLETADRWGVKEGQLSLASKMINSQLINRIVRQYIDDEINVSEAVDKMNAGLAAIE